ncbi:LysR family transcriptional regulator [Phytohabitans kaempferiae]|uniref:LysR family transcriptional regulator n=1 Tax=Phytohabitans kaempferiae TaxID=1620943 RepID=A0ABV6MH96_9ACTN
MDLAQIRCFLAVVDHGGINAAAASLDLAQPTVSYSITRLERELGVQLCHRLGRGVVLTSAGHAFVGPARRIMRDVVMLENSLVHASTGVTGRLDLVAIGSFAAQPILDTIAEFRARYPRVAIRVTDLRDEEKGGRLIRDGHCELVVCHLPAQDIEGLDVIPLGTQEWWLACPEGTELPPDDPLPLSKLPDIPHTVVPRGGSQAREIEQAVIRAGRVIRPVAVVQDHEARMPFVLAGVGASFLERSMAELARACGAVVRAVEPAISRQYGIVYDRTALSPPGSAFIEVAHRFARLNPDSPG